MASSLASTLPLLGLLVAEAVAVAGPAVAVQATATTGTPALASAARTIDAARLGRGAIAIDGRLDEAAWAAAVPRSNFWQRDPHEGQAPSFKTQFRVVYSDDALYVGIEAFDPEPDQIRGLLSRRDSDSSSDWLVLGIDSYHDRRTAFAFGVNPAGVQRDLLIFNDVEQDVSWDAVWESAAHVGKLGWTVELRIPYSQLRFAGGARQQWGLQVQRWVERTAEEDVWSPWPKGDNHIVSYFGSVRGLDRVTPPRRVELLPYGVLGTSLYQPATGDPLHHGHDLLDRAGLDFRLGLGSSFTVSGTINPDFGQVEADPSSVNLSASELYFQEKRPFFLEGTDIFKFGLAQGDGSDAVEQLFYSRRIGAAPHRDASAAADAVFVDQPSSTSIYGAAKLAGKTAGGWSLGLLDAVTGQAEAQVIDPAGQRDRVVVEPLTNYAVARVHKDLRAGRTTFGAALTAVHRSLAGVRLDQLDDEGYAGGLELDHRFADDEWSVKAKAIGSLVHGSATALDAIQTSSVHYFQNPDTGYRGYDPTRTSLAGYGLQWSLGKTAGGQVRYATGADTRSPGLEVNDLGFQTKSDYYQQWAWLQLRDDHAGARVRDWQLTTNAWSTATYQPAFQDAGVSLNGAMSFLNNWTAGSGLDLAYTRRDSSGLRGGPTLRHDPGLDGWIDLSTDARRLVRGDLHLFGYDTPASNSHGLGVSPTVTVQAASNLDLSAGPSFFAGIDDNQYVATATDQAGAPRYVMARLRQTTVSLTLRLDYTVSPRLSLQLYAQPFISSGGFGAYKEVVAPQAARYRDRYHLLGPGELREAAGVFTVDRNQDGAIDYQFAAPDFDFRQLRSNLVLRWEYRPGSTLFLIWSHDRTSQTADGSFRLGPDTAGLYHEVGEHLLMAKLTYWMGL